MGILRLAFGFCLALGFVANGHGAEAVRYVVPQAGISVIKPARWVVAEQQDATSGNILFFTRYREPIARLNPSCRITVINKRDAKGKNARELLDQQIELMEKDFKDFTIIKAAQEVEVGGKPSVALQAAYSAATKRKKKIEVSWRIWYVTHDESVFRIIMAAPPKGRDSSEKEFEQILRSVQFVD